MISNLTITQLDGSETVKALEDIASVLKRLNGVVLGVVVGVIVDEHYIPSGWPGNSRVLVTGEGDACRYLIKQLTNNLEEYHMGGYREIVDGSSRRTNRRGRPPGRDSNNSGRGGNSSDRPEGVNTQPD